MASEKGHYWNKRYRDSKLSMNQGTIAEAMEGLINHDIKESKFKEVFKKDSFAAYFEAKENRKDWYTHLYYASHNADIWYKGGDINNIQVKYFGRKNSIKTASLLSISYMCTFLIQFFNNLSLANVDSAAEQFTKVFFEQAHLELDNLTID